MTDSDAVRDLIIVGTGPAGMVAGTQAERYGFDSVLFESGSLGGELSDRHSIHGYPGFPEGVGGPELRSRLVTSLERYDAEVVLTEVEGVRPGSPHIVETDSGDYRTETVIVATGGHPQRLGIPGETEYEGRGVFHCAQCDGPLYRDEKVIVTGGNGHALVDALYLAEYASEVLVVDPDLDPTTDRILLERVEGTPNLTVETGTEVSAVNGQNGTVDSVRLHNRETDTERVEAVGGLYVHVGLEPNTAFLDGTVQLDGEGRIVVDEKMETTVDGVFAAGDIRTHSPQEVAAAVGDGTVASEAVRRYLE